MNLENNIDFSQLETEPARPKIPEETFASITYVFFLSAKFLLKSFLIVIPYIILSSTLFLFLSKHIGMNFNSEVFWVAVAHNDITTITAMTEQIIESFFIITAFYFVMLVLDTIFYTAIAAKAMGSNLEKLEALGQIFFKNFFIILIILFFKISLILLGSTLLIPGIIIWLSMMFVEYVVIFEKKNLFEAIKHSNRLMTGCKSSFLNFFTIASLALIPIFVGKSYYIFADQMMSFTSTLVITQDLLLSILIELINSFVYGTYFCGTCLLYFKRAQVINKLEAQL